MDTAQQWAGLIAAAAEPHSRADNESIVRSAIELGLQVAPDSVGCSITEMSHQVFSTPVASGELAMALDQAQYVENRGPCVDAARDQRSYRLDQIASTERYPTFAAAAASYGVLSSLSVPMPRATIPSALNLYAASDSAFDHPQPKAVASLLARCIGLLRGVIQPDLPADAALDEAWRDHGAVRRAQAFLAERDGLNPNDAYVRLVQLARARDEPVARAAQRVLVKQEGQW